MKKVLKILLITTLILNMLSLTVLANSGHYEFDQYGMKKEIELGNNFKSINGNWIEFDEKNDVQLKKEWTIVFSGEVIKDKIDGMVIEKDNKFIPVEIELTGENQATITPVNSYESSSRYCLKIFLNNGNRYKMYFNTDKAEIQNPVDDLNENGYDEMKIGSIKGNITWQYNRYIGTKADTGAKIALIPTNLSNKSENSFFALLLQQNPQGKDGIYTAKADGYGTYEIQDVPAGEYYLLISSNNTRSDMKIYTFDEERLKKLFSEKDWNKLKMPLKLNKYELKAIKIEENKTIIQSYDFGYTYI